MATVSASNRISILVLNSYYSIVVVQLYSLIKMILFRSAVPIPTFDDDSASIIRFGVGTESFSLLAKN